MQELIWFLYWLYLRAPSIGIMAIHFLFEFKCDNVLTGCTLLHCGNIRLESTLSLFKRRTHKHLESVLPLSMLTVGMRYLCCFTFTDSTSWG